MRLSQNATGRRPPKGTAPGTQTDVLPTTVMPAGIWWRRGSGCALLLALSLLAQGGLDVELDADLLADDHAAGLERLVVGQAPVFAVDLGRSREGHGVAAPRCGVGAVELHVQAPPDV